MFEHVCSLPLSADVFAQATHPTLPIFAVGLASGHVRAFRLPPIEKTTPKDEHTNGEGGIKVNGRLAHTARARSSSITSTTGPINTVSTIWSTHRHKGSCRALAFSTDGTTLYSAGSDGLIKAADAETGRVVGKVAIPFETSRITNKDAASYPSVLLALSPQTLVLGTDGGTIHIYTLSEHVSPHTPLAKHAVPTATPSQTLRPHRTEFDPTNTEAIAALAALPPSATSTSRTSRAFVSAAGSTLAVTDIRKGVVATSIDQGDVLLAAACVSLAPPRNAPADADRKRKKGARGRNPDEGHDPNDKVLLGSSEGLLTLWNRGEWEDQRSRTAIGGGGLSPMGVDDDAGVDCLAVMPGDEGAPSRTRVVAAGLGSGAVKLIEVRAGKGAGFAQVVGEVSHDERAVEGVLAVGFEAGGRRMMTAGGEIVKVWCLKEESGEDNDGWVDTDASDEPEGGKEDANGDKESDDEAEEEEAEDEDAEDEEDSESEEEEKPKRKRRKGKKDTAGIHGHHGVLAFKGMD